MEVDIADPIHGGINVAPVVSLVRHPVVQRLNRIKQLGGLQTVFPSATHTRFSHSLGVFHITSQRVAWLASTGLITPEQALACQIVAILHDVGHRSYSHLIESLSGNHDERGLSIMQDTLRPFIEDLGVTMEMIEEIATRKDKLGDLIYHTPLGADKLDYLVRDTYFAMGGIYNFRDLYQTHIGWSPETGIYLHSRGLVDFLQLMETYWSLYAKMYERVSGRVAQRYLQELIRLCIKEVPGLALKVDSGGEDELIGAIAVWCDEHPDHSCAKRYNRLASRTHPRKAFILAVRPQLMGTRTGEVHAVLPCDPALIERSWQWSLEDISRIEQAISEELGVASWEVSLTPAPPKRRWQVPELMVMVPGGALCSVTELLPELYKSCNKYVQIGLNVVVSLTHTHRLRLSPDPVAQEAVFRILASS